jgi:F-type H+-transporting ATPase subunit gamma
MKFVAASRLRKSQERMMSARPYAHQMLRMLNSLAARTDPHSHPLLAIREEKQITAIVITGDKGLCGAFNTNIIKASVDFLENQSALNKELQLILIGRKGRDYYRRRAYTVRSELVNVMDRFGHDSALAIGRQIIEAFTENRIDAAYIIYNEFKSVIQQRLIVEHLLPISRLHLGQAETALEYIFEQPAKSILDDLLPKHVIMQIYHAMLESSAAEQAARMTAMEAATNNAGEMIEQLTLKMNRIRQASITKEIIEVVSGANALT